MIKKGYLYIVLSTLLFSITEVSLKISSTSLNPIQLTFSRFLIGSIILLPVAIKNLMKKGIRLSANDYIFFTVFGFFLIPVTMLLYQMAIEYSQASIVSVLFCSNPVFVIVFSWLIFHKRLEKQTAISVILWIVGIIVFISPSNTSGKSTGIILAMASAIIYAFCSLASRKQSEKYGGVVLTCFSFLFGSIELILLMLVGRINGIIKIFSRAGLKILINAPLFYGINLHTLPGLLFISIFVTGLGFVFYFLAIEKTTVEQASLTYFFKLVLAPFFASIIIHETISANMYIGIIFIVAGSFLFLLPVFQKRSKHST